MVATSHGHYRRRQPLGATTARLVTCCEHPNEHVSRYPLLQAGPGSLVLCVCRDCTHEWREYCGDVNEHVRGLNNGRRLAQRAVEQAREGWL